MRLYLGSVLGLVSGCLTCALTAMLTAYVLLSSAPVFLRLCRYQSVRAAVCLSITVALWTMLIFTAFYDAVAQRNPALERLRNRQATLDSFYSDKEMGCTVSGGKTTFRIFAPRATQVNVVIYERHNSQKGEEFTMQCDEQGVWEYVAQGELYGKFYGYRVFGVEGPAEMFNPEIVIADPYSKAVCTRNNFRRYPARTLIANLQYNWEGDTWVISPDHTSLIIYEAHVRDLTAHPSSGVVARGTYAGLVEQGKRGGLSHLKDLGINAIELLPIQSFGAIEIPYQDSSVITLGYPVNTWNPYARNHWGYMTSYFFAPEAYYSRGASMIPDAYNGMDAHAVREFKDMVKALHKEGIAVILDVVFNHVSQYDYNPFKYIDKFYYFHLDSEGRFLSNSGCGNDFRTDRPMARKMILDCIRYWMTEYHIDGFRFDLAAMIDEETRRQIATEARKINPNVILIAEPWGGGRYEPHRFSDVSWAAWNDQIRNGFKGQNPDNGHGFIFGKFQGHNTPHTIRNYVVGTLRQFGGLFHTPAHSVNYLESHDDHTLGDFIRLALHEVNHHTRITNLDEHAKLSPKALALNKLAALLLFTAQGITMIHEGQEYARSKVIVPTDVPDPNVGRIDHNSYEKDNETNYLNYYHLALNTELYRHYKALISLRKRYPIFHCAPPSAIEFFDTNDSLVLAFRLHHRRFAQVMLQANAEPYRTYGLQADADFIVICNAHPHRLAEFMLPSGKWVMLGHANEISLEKVHSASGKLYIPPTAGVILMGK